jgi:hypothetical protein
MMLHLEDIKARFLNEQNYVLRYVEFLQSASAVRDSDIAEISNILHRHKLPKVPRPKYWSTSREQYSLDELTTLVDALRAIMPDINTKISEYENNLDKLPAPKGLEQVDARSILGEWIDYMMHALEHDSSLEAIAAVKQKALEHEEEIIHEMGDEAEPMQSEDFDYAIQSALFIIARRRLNEILYVRDRYIDLDLAARMIQPKAEINILRQGFILLLTAFDAAVFDLVRVAFTKDFFRLIGVFGKQEKISLEALARYGSFDRFRDEVIEEQLKARYLKDLLFLLDGLGVQCIDKARGERLIELVELVMRRNVHVHNRGIVDERYLERDQKGKPQFNIYNLALGSVAEIDGPYWERANRLCRNCVDNLAAWGEKLGSTGTSTP